MTPNDSVYCCNGIQQFTLNEVFLITPPAGTASFQAAETPGPELHPIPNAHASMAAQLPLSLRAKILRAKSDKSLFPGPCFSPLQSNEDDSFLNSRGVARGGADCAGLRAARRHPCRSRICEPRVMAASAGLRPRRANEDRNRQGPCALWRAPRQDHRLADCHRDRQPRLEELGRKTARRGRQPRLASGCSLAAARPR